MFSSHYFPRRFFSPRYFVQVGGNAPAPTTHGPFPHSYFSGRFFCPSLDPPETFVTPGPAPQPEPGEGGTFPHRYFPKGYFNLGYFPPTGRATPLTPSESTGPFAHHYFSSRYFPARYFGPTDLKAQTQTSGVFVPVWLPGLFD